MLFDYFVGDVGGFLAEVVFAFAFVVFAGDVAHEGDDDAVIIIDDDGHANILSVVVEIELAFVDVVFFRDCFGEGGGVEYADDVASHHFFFFFDVHQGAGGGVDLLDGEFAVHHDDSVGGVADDLVGKGFGARHEIGHAHIDFRFAHEYGVGFFAAGFIAARAAVQFMLGLCLSHFFKGFLDRAVADIYSFNGRWRKCFL